MDNCDKAAANKGLVAVEDAIEQLLKMARPVCETQENELAQARGRILAKDITSPLLVPPHDNSAMDGYAIRVADLDDKQEKGLPVSQRINAGAAGQTPLAAASAARIFTGAPVPPGADAVIMQEQARRDGNTVFLRGPVQAGQNIRRAGEDIKPGDVVVAAGERLTPQMLGIAASVGTAALQVFRRPRVAVLSTGDELVNPGTDLAPGQIYNSNRFTLGALLETLGCQVFDLGIVRDSHDATKDALVEAARQADLVMTSGGVSVGEEDHVRNVLEEIGHLDLWRLNMKPGKPLAFGHYHQTPFIGLPGNPVSVLVTFIVIARPFVLKMMGASNHRTTSFRVAAGFDWPRPQSRREYLRVRLDEHGRPVCYPHQGSGVLSSLAWADGLAIAPENTTFAKGDSIEYLPFCNMIG